MADFSPPSSLFLRLTAAEARPPKDTMTHRVCRGSTEPNFLRRAWAGAALPLLALGVTGLLAQVPVTSVTADWRRLGNAAIFRPGSDLATGPVERVWYDGEQLTVRTASGVSWRTSDYETWAEVDAVPPPPSPPERGHIRYRLAGDLYRSEDGGQSWRNLTALRSSASERSVLPGRLRDVAVHPSNPDEVVVAATSGVWRTVDGGVTWAGLNRDLPALAVSRILALPQGPEPLRVAAGEDVLEWRPGQRLGWIRIRSWPARPVETAAVGEYLYVGSANGEILAYRGPDPRPPFRAGGPVTRFWIHPQDGALALAIAGGKLYRTFNGGAYWDDVTGTLAAEAVTAVAVDVGTRTIYAGRRDGVYWAAWDFALPGAAPAWQLWSSPADGTIRDLRLDAAGHFLFAAVEGWGVYSTLAPHRRASPAVVSAADLASRAASPGALLSVLGPAVTSARSGERSLPVLSSAAGESHLQLPFDLTAAAVSLRLEADNGNWNLALPLRAAAPAIVVDRDGSPWVLDADSGVLLDALHPLRPGMRLQILATGLGRVRPAWPLATPAPANRPPVVVSPVTVRLDGQPLTVLSATLAPGYIGFYLVEAEVPALVNAGTALLSLAVDTAESNPVRVYIEP